MKTEFKAAGTDTLIIKFSDAVTPEIQKLVIKNYEILKPLFLETVPSYNTILVKYGIDRTFENITDYIKEKLVLNPEEINTASKTIHIPAYYPEETGNDLKQTAYYNNLSVKELIKKHSDRLYSVYAVGFLPGFAYMGITDIKTPEKRNERNIFKGDIGICFQCTGIYPQDSRGKWNIIARTFMDVSLNESEKSPLFKIGDKVKFEPVQRYEFINQGGRIESD